MHNHPIKKIPKIIVQTINYGSKKINYNLTFSQRKTLGIKVLPNGAVNVAAPALASIIDIEKKVKTKAAWILKQQHFFCAYYPITPTRKFISGETHLYLGRQYLLQVKSEKIKVKSEYVKLYCGKMEVYTNNPTPQNIEKIITKFYKEKAVEVITPMYEECKKVFAKKLATVHYPLFTLHCSLKNFSLRVLKKRWGSCTKAGKIILNTELIKAPKASIEYVIIHELCHLIHYNHNKDFYALQNKLYPNWERWKEKLEQALA